MRLTTVGTGTAAPTRGRVQAAHLVETAGVRLLLDCGSGASFRLADLGVEWQTITHLAITHFHADHILDIPTMLTAWRYGMLPPRSAPLELIGPPGTIDVVNRLTEATGVSFRDYGFAVNVREMAHGERIPLGNGPAIESRAVPHTPESVAYLVEADATRLVYSGDMGYDEGFARWAAGCDLLLCECSLPDSMAIPSHLTPSQVGRIAGIAQPGLLALTHFYPPVEQVDIGAAIAAHHAGPVVVCRDGWGTDI